MRPQPRFLVSSFPQVRAVENSVTCRTPAYGEDSIRLVAYAAAVAEHVGMAGHGRVRAAALRCELQKARCALRNVQQLSVSCHQFYQSKVQKYNMTLGSECVP